MIPGTGCKNQMPHHLLSSGAGTVQRLFYFIFFKKKNNILFMPLLCSTFARLLPDLICTVPLAAASIKNRLSAYSLWNGAESSFRDSLRGACWNHKHCVERLRSALTTRVCRGKNWGFTACRHGRAARGVWDCIYLPYCDLDLVRLSDLLLAFM